MMRRLTVAFVVLLCALVPALPSAAQEGQIAGTVPADGGVALIVWGGGSVAELAPAARARGCNLASAWVTRAGQLIGNTVGAPAFVNAEFESAVGPSISAGTPLIIVCRRSGPATGAPSLWVAAWYAGWLQGEMPPTEIDFSAITHLMHFTLEPTATGELGTDTSMAVPGRPGFETPSRIASVVRAAHAADRKVLVTVGGVSVYEAFRSAITPEHRATLVHNLVDFVTEHRYDGVDVDMEPINPADYGNFQAFIAELRDALDAVDPALLISVAGPPHGASDAICPVQGHIDHINVMTYEISGAFPGWVTWHNSPISSGGARFPGGGELPSAHGYLQEYINDGCAKRKLAVSLSFYAHVWEGGAGTDTGGVTRPQQSWTTPPESHGNVPYFEIARAFDLRSYLWDPVAQAAYISVDRAGSEDDRFISFDNEQTAQAKVDYAREAGLGGIAIWEVAGGYLKNAPPGQRDPLLQAVNSAILGRP